MFTLHLCVIGTIEDEGEENEEESAKPRPIKLKLEEYVDRTQISTRMFVYVLSADSTIRFRAK